MAAHPSKKNSRKLILAILGPTAAGKSDFAVDICKRIGGEILCLDSTTVYKGFDIGSSKPGPEQRSVVPHHLIDALEPEADFSAAEFSKMAFDAIQSIHQRGRIPVLVGGTYFYLRALQHGMYPVSEIPKSVFDTIEKEFADNTAAMHSELSQADAEAAQSIHPNDQYRLTRALAIWRSTGKKPSTLKAQSLWPEQKTWLWMKYALLVPRKVLAERIRTRAQAMLNAGWLDEVRALRQAHPTARALGSVGYAQVCQYLDGKLGHDKLIEAIEDATRYLAKKQLTWLRSDPELRFVDPSDIERVEKEVTNLVAVMEGKL
jgi:tRNA dimethylallyltransferase